MPNFVDQSRFSGNTEWRDRSIPQHDAVAAQDPRYIKSFETFTVSNPHPGFGKDPNILNEIGHTAYPKWVYPNGKDHPGVIVNNPDEEDKALGKEPTKSTPLREDGPTVEEYIDAGYKAVDYPPKGYASKSSEEEIKAAIEKQSVKHSW